MITRVAKVFPLFSNNNEGKRYSLPNSRIMIHQPLGGAQGGQTDIDIQVCSFSFPFLCLLLEHPNALYLSSTPQTNHPTQHIHTVPVSASTNPPKHPLPLQVANSTNFFFFLNNWKTKPLRNSSAIWTMFLLSITSGCCKLNSLVTYYFTHSWENSVRQPPFLFSKIVSEMSEVLLKVIVCHSLWGK